MPSPKHLMDKVLGHKETTSKPHSDTMAHTHGPDVTRDNAAEPMAGAHRDHSSTGVGHVDTTRDQHSHIPKPGFHELANKVNPTVATRDTEVSQLVNPAATKETVKPHEKEETNLQYQREVHQDHYQTRVQPVLDREVLPEQHVQQTLPTEHREYKAGNKHEVENLVNKERTAFQDTRTVLPTERHREDGHVVAEETRHHHVHEVIQPVLEREVIQPTVVHTTIPIKEHIEKDAVHHPKTVQPAVTLEEFKGAGGILEGRSASRTEVFEGEPRAIPNGGADVKHPHGRSHGLRRSGSASSSSSSEAD